MQVIQTFFRNIQMFIIRVYMIRLGKAAVSNQTVMVYLVLYDEYEIMLYQNVSKLVVS